MLTEFEWQAIIEGIESKQCIICLGPEVYSINNPEGQHKSMVERLSVFLKEHQRDLNIKVQENAWFHLNPGGSDGPAYQAIKSFYGNVINPRSKTLLEKIARIKFHLFLPLSPDYHLRNAFEDQGLTYKFDSYVRNQPDKHHGVATNQTPLVYNILGELDNRNSLVLTYDDFYDYLESVIKGNSMSQLIKDNILDAQYFLFIGIPFDQWFVHLFMRVLRQHKERKTKFATSGQVSQNSIDICKEQYHIMFVNTDIENFTDELYNRCEQRNLIKNLNERQEQAQNNNSVLDSLKNWIEKNEFEKLVKKLKEILKGAGESGKPLLLNVIQLSGEYNTLKEKKNLGIIKYEDEVLTLNTLRKKFFDLVNLFADRMGL